MPFFSSCSCRYFLSLSPHNSLFLFLFFSSSLITLHTLVMVIGLMLYHIFVVVILLFRYIALGRSFAWSCLALHWFILCVYICWLCLPFENRISFSLSLKWCYWKHVIMSCTFFLYTYNVKRHKRPAFDVRTILQWIGSTRETYSDLLRSSFFSWILRVFFTIKCSTCPLSVEKCIILFSHRKFSIFSTVY